MKITVVTPFDSANYGAFLQAYCLKRKLEQWGHDVYHVLTRDEEYIKRLYYRDKPVRKKEWLFYFDFRKKRDFGIRKMEKFQEDQKVFHVLSENQESDVFILGSDEIWNIRQEAFRKDIFWGIGANNVISYAASIGNADIEALVSDERYIQAVQNLKGVLVRDVRTKEFINQISHGPKAEIVCDPTMLIPVEEYGNEFVDDYVAQNRCFLVYAYYVSDKQKKTIKTYAKKHQMKVVSCCFWHSWCDYQCECSPLQFSGLIRQCDAVFTTTFHGSIFSILNHANFISVPISAKTNQLLEQFGLEDRLMDEAMCSVDQMEAILNGEKINYFEVDNKIKEIRKKSEEKLINQLNQISGGSMEFNYQICKSEKCTGCFACMNKCPVNAITEAISEDGRTIPDIDKEKCIKCGFCASNCPVNTPITLVKPQKCYAAQRPEIGEREKSSSGGVGAVLAEYIIANGGCVFGATVTEAGEVQHICAESKEEINKLRSSKYVQSGIGFSYRSVKKELMSGRKVLFVGTPCQIAGLKRYLLKEYENLFCVDLICHGVPPMKYLRDHYIHVMKDSKIESVSFRNPRIGFYLTVKGANHTVYEADRFNDSYFHAFFKALSYRENCYHCIYATQGRCGDLTIGDFWGINRKTLERIKNGYISAVLINSPKGLALFEFVKDKLTYEERELQEAVKGNKQLQHPSNKHKLRDQFINAYCETHNFDLAAEKINLVSEMKKEAIKMKTIRLYQKIRWKAEVIFRRKT